MVTKPQTPNLPAEADLPLYRCATGGSIKLPGDFGPKFYDLATQYHAASSTDKAAIKEQMNALLPQVYQSPELLAKGFTFRIHHREKKRRAVAKVICHKMQWNADTSEGPENTFDLFSLYCLVEMNYPDGSTKRKAIHWNFLTLMDPATAA